MAHVRRILIVVLIFLLMYLVATALHSAHRSDIAERGGVAVATEGADELLPLLFLGGSGGRPDNVGGRPLTPPEDSKNVVVDTLNLAHWLRRSAAGRVGTGSPAAGRAGTGSPAAGRVGTGSSAAGRAGAPLTTCEIVDAIETTAPVLRESFPGRITYVLKDRETDSAADAARAREILRAAGRRAGVSVAVVEKGSAPPPRPDAGQKHAALGRDDFYIALLAREYGCPVLSRDRFRDLRDMKSGHLPPFRVYLYTPHARRGAPPERTYVTPAAPEYGGLRRPRVLDFSRYLPWWSK